MKKLLLITSCFLTLIAQAQITGVLVTEVANMPEPISNNAVVEGWVNGVPHVYSFSGIDSTKLFSGINLNSFRYNTVTNFWDTIPSLPDTLGKIAAGASNVNNIIYIIGGYHVFQNGNELSSNKVHRYDPENNVYLSDGADIPVAIDDHVQAVYNDSLIYVITGWNNTNNVANVQIYDPANNNWLVGTSVPNNNTYRAFGASGTIIGNTIYYHGGASSSFNFPGQSTLRIGVIDAIDPTQITWSSQQTNEITYRSSCVAGSILNTPFWIGGSEVTYNFDGIAYNGSGGVSPRSTVLAEIGGGGLLEASTPSISLPMDLRGIASFDLTTKYIAGGMLSGQKVSNKAYLVAPLAITGIEENNNSIPVKIYPNPSSEFINLEFESNISKQITLIDILGNEILTTSSSKTLTTIDASSYPKGNYIIKISSEEGNSTKKVTLQ